jgi:hypothetical protein
MAPHELSIEAHRQEDCHSLIVRGHIDAESCTALIAMVRHVCGEGARELLLDLEELELADSSARRAVTASRLLCEEFMCVLCVRLPRGHAGPLFRLARLLDRLPFRGGGRLDRGARTSVLAGGRSRADASR